MRKIDNIDELKKELKRVASLKCRLNKQRGKASYAEEFAKVVEYEEYLKELRDTLTDRKKTVTQYTLEDVVELSYDETMRALKSIQSKKSNTKWLTSVEGDNDEYRNACRIEEMLRAHKETLQPSTKRDKIVEIIELSGDLSKEEIVEMLKALV